MDSLALYTVKLATRKHPRQQSPPPTPLADSILHNTDKPLSPFIFCIKSWAPVAGDKVPKLRKDDLLSILFHADEQWLESVKELIRVAKDGDDGGDQNDAQLSRAMERVHRQQAIFLDSLALLHQSIQPKHGSRRFQEAVLFAAQVLCGACHISHLTSFTPILAPLAQSVCLSLEMLRKVARAMALKPIRHRSTLSHKILETRLDDLAEHWQQFETILYQCYAKAVFDDAGPWLLDKGQWMHTQPLPLPRELFRDPFTSLLPKVLERALAHGWLNHDMITQFDPMAFIAVPRLAVFAGMTWLSALSGWRRTRHFPTWFHHGQSSMTHLVVTMDAWEQSVVDLNSAAGYKAHVSDCLALEMSLVSGRDPQHTDRTLQVYRDICAAADGILTGPGARPFTVILRHLFLSFSKDISVESLQA